MKEFVVKDLLETFIDKPYHEIHLKGCSHLERNVRATSKPIKAEKAEDVIKIDDAECYDPSWSPKKYKISPCTN